MSAQITVTYLSYTVASPTVISATTAVIPMPAALTKLDSARDVSTQTGFSGLDVLLQGIVKRKGIQFVDSSGVQTFIPLSQIVKIVGA